MELLVVIAIIALLMGVLMPALAQVRRLAQRIICGTNLSGIGKACTVYANDNEEDFPRAGGRGSKWDTDQGGQILKWDAESTTSKTAEAVAFGDPPNANTATITSCFFLLIKYTDGTPKLFVCKGDIGTSVFKLSDAGTNTNLADLTDVHDFGIEAHTGKVPGEYSSYSYHLPFSNDNGNNPLNSSSRSGSPLAADRNPFMDENALDLYLSTTGLSVVGEDEDPSWKNSEFSDPDKVRNTAAHQREGQNVLYVDAHVAFEKAPNVGIEDDNIYICWVSNYPQTTVTAKENMQLGEQSGMPNTKKGDKKWGPYKQEDAFLVNEYNSKN